LPHPLDPQPTPHLPRLLVSPPIRRFDKGKLSESPLKVVVHALSVLGAMSMTTILGNVLLEHSI